MARKLPLAALRGVDLLKIKKILECGDASPL